MLWSGRGADSPPPLAPALQQGLSGGAAAGNPRGAPCCLYAQRMSVARLLQPLLLVYASCWLPATLVCLGRLAAVTHLRPAVTRLACASTPLFQTRVHQHASAAAMRRRTARAHCCHPFPLARTRRWPQQQARRWHQAPYLACGLSLRPCSSHPRNYNSTVQHRDFAIPSTLPTSPIIQALQYYTTRRHTTPSYSRTKPTQNPGRAVHGFLRTHHLAHFAERCASRHIYPTPHLHTTPTFARCTSDLNVY